LRVCLEDFAGFLKARLKPPIPVELVRSEPVFTPFWRKYVEYVSSALGRIDPRAAEEYGAIASRAPSVAVVPRRDVFIAFAREEEFEDIYLAFNWAAVSAARGRHLHVVPLIGDDAVDALVAGGVNPAVLSEVLYALPALASVPCTALARDLPLVRDLLTLRMHGYLSSSDLGQAVLGYILLKLLSRLKSGGQACPSYEAVVEEVKSVAVRALEKRMVRVVEYSVSGEFAEFPVDIDVLVVRAGGGQA